MATIKKKPVKKPVSFVRQLRQLGACEEAVEWVGKKSAATAWKQCQNIDWLCWMLDRGDVPRDKMRGMLLELMAFALDAARVVASKEAYWPKVEESHRLVREALQGRGDLAAARDAALTAASVAWATARAAWDAAACSTAAADAAAAAAAGDVAGAAWDAAGATARAAVCDIIRKHFPRPPRLVRAKP